jgi:hypothetical protein
MTNSSDINYHDKIMEENKAVSAIDREIILSILQNIRETNYIGPIANECDFGEHVNYALNKGLIERTNTGNFLLSIKGVQLLGGMLEWRDL